MKKSDLPQVCGVCRKLKSASLGKFRRGARYSQWIWECDSCLDKPRERTGESHIEKEVRAAVSGIEKFRQEFEVAGFSFDFAFPRIQLLVEVNSVRWHTRQFHRKRDARKAAAAEAAGWKLVRVAGEDVAGQAVAAVLSRKAEFGH